MYLLGMKLISCDHTAETIDRSIAVADDADMHLSAVENNLPEEGK